MDKKDKTQTKKYSPELFDAIRKLMAFSSKPEDELDKIKSIGHGVNKKDILKVYQIIKSHDTEKDRLEKQKLLFEKPLIVPPGLNSAVLHFEAHFSVSGDDPIMILGPTGVGKSLFLYLARCLFKKKHQYDTIPPVIVEANCAHFSSGSGGLQSSPFRVIWPCGRGLHRRS